MQCRTCRGLRQACLQAPPAAWHAAAAKSGLLISHDLGPSALPDLIASHLALKAGPAESKLWGQSHVALGELHQLLLWHANAGQCCALAADQA